MKSNTTYHYLFKYAFLFLGLFIMTIPAISFVIPESVEINGERGPMDDTSAIIVVLIGLLFVIIFFIIKDKFAVVELKNQTTIITQNGEESAVNWLDVISLSQIQFIQPPLYQLKTKDGDETIWFNTEPKYFSIGGFTSDLSEMGQFIKKKKMELEL